MSKLVTYLDAIRIAQHEEMERDSSVIVMGEDIRLNMYGSTGGLFETFGGDRVLDTPMSENGFVGCGVGAAMTGLRPIVDMGMASFLFCAVDQLVSQASKNRYMFGGQRNIPVTYRAALFYNRGGAAHHADRPYPMFMGIPGLKVIVPASPADAKGLLKTAIREDDPVMCFEDSACWPFREEIPEGDHLVPFGKGRIRREGSDVTIVAIAGAVWPAMAAADELAKEGISAEIVDPRTLVPLDRDMILNSVAKTGRLLVADPAARTCGAAAEISAIVAEEAFDALKNPIVRITAPDIPIPFSKVLESPLYPNKGRILAGVRRIIA
ncbi:MAG: alpha-ketoacid dehydrogenase subunit beta [Rhodospirillales bacterium 69-11]|nr:MAG: alpha-ketoacid dehydrogenase subunit beta [Rhodospirillales bacterium 69-11]